MLLQNDYTILYFEILCYPIDTGAAVIMWGGLASIFKMTRDEPRHMMCAGGCFQQRYKL